MTKFEEAIVYGAFGTLVSFAAVGPSQGAAIGGLGGMLIILLFRVGR